MSQSENGDKSSNARKFMSGIGNTVLVNAPADQRRNIASTTLLTQPHDLLERIILQLSPPDIRNCTLVSKQFNTVIRSSIILQYRLACHAAGVVDNPRCKLPYSERYETLVEREQAWSKIQPIFTKTFDVQHLPSDVFDLTAGVFVSNDINGRDVHYCRLPSMPDDVPRWNVIHGHGPNKNWNGIFAEMGLAVYEHDLIINVISSPIDGRGNRTIRSLNMILLQFSTGEYHSLARYPRIHIQDVEEESEIMLSVVGDNVAMVNRNKLFIFNWKTGDKKLQHQTGEDGYPCLCFLSPEILIIPNILQNQFEVWKIPEEADNSVPYQIVKLCFPDLSKGQAVLHVRCRGEPNPYLHDVPHAPLRPFHHSADNTIIVITVFFESSGSDLDPEPFTIVMHRSSLLDTIARLEHTNASRLLYVGRQSDVLVNNAYDSGMQYSSKDYQMYNPFPPEERYDVRSIPWSFWGPPISRWFHSGEIPNSWITISAGQRLVVFDPVDNRKGRIKIYDFNPHNIRDDDQDDLPGELFIGRKGDHFGRSNIFAEDHEMGLGCRVYTAPDVYDFDGLLMDEERLLGIKVRSHRITPYAVLTSRGQWMKHGGTLEQLLYSTLVDSLSRIYVLVFSLSAIHPTSFHRIFGTSRLWNGYTSDARLLVKCSGPTQLVILADTCYEPIYLARSCTYG